MARRIEVLEEAINQENMTKEILSSGREGMTGAIKSNRRLDVLLRIPPLIIEKIP